MGRIGRSRQSRGRKLRTLTLEEEYKYGADFDSAIKDPARAKETGVTIKTIEGHPAADYIRRIGQRLAAVSIRPELTYTFQLIDEQSVNAFATMGGYVYMHSGLLKSAENEAQVAAVMAHEISHIGRKHALQAMANQAVYGGWAKGVGGFGGLIINLTSAVMFQLPGSRTFEFEADSYGLDTLRRAGYPAQQMVVFFRNVLAKGDPNDGQRHDWLSTHPDTARRIRALEEKLTAGDLIGYGMSSAEHQQAIQGLP